MDERIELSTNDEDINAVKARCVALVEKFNATPESAREQRDSLLRQIFKKVGKDPVIKTPIYCSSGVNISVGDHFVANFCCVFQDAVDITIGDNCLIGPQTGLYTVNHPLDPAARAAGVVYPAPITIGDNVWIGGNCVILPGVTIGDNAVIGAGSVVTKDIPANAIAVGSPARVIRYLGESDRTGK